MTDKELLKLFRRAQVFVTRLIEQSPLCEAEVIQWGQARGECIKLEKLFDEFREEPPLNPGKLQHLVQAGLITQQERVAYIKDYNQNKNNLKKIYNLHPKKGNKGGNGNNGNNGNNGQGGGPP